MASKIISYGNKSDIMLDDSLFNIQKLLELVIDSQKEYLVQNYKYVYYFDEVKDMFYKRACNKYKSYKKGSVEQFYC